jgi:hypothetical protein
MNNTLDSNKDEEFLMLQLRDILLRDDRATLSAVKKVLDEKDLLADRVSPIVEEHLENMRQNFPQEYEQLVTKMIEQKLKSSQKEIVEVIYPVLGQMIIKFISLQFQILKESIDKQIKETFSTKTIMDKIRYRFMGVKSSDIIIAAADVPYIEEVFVIQKNSGLLLGSAALYPTENRDAVAGMLTAIKDFVEDAFEKDREDLETINYGTYRVMLYSFPTYYFAMALSGSLSTSESENFRKSVFQFAEKTPELRSDDVDDKIQKSISEGLDSTFISPQRQLTISNV